MKLFNLLKNPTEFLEGIRNEEWESPFKFFLAISVTFNRRARYEFFAIERRFFFSIPSPDYSLVTFENTS